MRPRICNLLLALSLSCSCFAQPDTKEYIGYLLAEARQTINLDLDSSFALAEQALRLSQTQAYRELEGKCLEWMGFVEAEQGRYLESLQHLKAGELVLTEISSPHLAQLYNAMGITYKYLNEYGKALNFQFLSLETMEGQTDTSFQSTVYNSIGNLYATIGDDSNAKKYFLYAIESASSLLNLDKLATYYINLSNLYSHDGKQRLRYLLDARQICVQHTLDRQLAYVYEGMAKFFLESDEIDSSLAYFQRSEITALKARDSIMAMHQSVQFYCIMAEFRNAIIASENLEKLLQDPIVRNDNELAHKGEIFLSKALARINKHQEALEVLARAKDREDILTNQEIVRQSAIYNAKYESEKKEAEITRQQLIIAKQKNNRRSILLVGLFLLASLALIAQYLINRQKRQKKETELQLTFEKERATHLQKLDRAKTDLFNNVSHELRTPLTMIIGPLEEVSQKLKNVELRKDVEQALGNSKRLVGLVNEILDLSKLDAGKMQIESKAIWLKAFLNRVFHAYDSLAAAQKIGLEDNLDAIESEILIRSDIAKLEKIINNLVSNAIKYSQSGDIVKLSIDHKKLDKDLLSISIIDEGLGISEGDQGRIFDRYYQSSAHSQTAGTGIGLALTKELCELLGGKITVQSDGKRGSTFTFEVPIQKKISHRSGQMENDEIVVIDAHGSAVLPSSRPQILIVEDDIEMSNYLKGLLTPQCDCTLAYNGQQAMEVLRTRSFDLISSDIMMPSMDGFEFREEINKDPRIRNTPFIMLTARALEEDKLRGFQLGIDDYLTKPFSPGELKARIYNLLKNKIVRSEWAEVELSHEEDLLERAKKLVVENLSNPTFKVTDLAQALHYSPRQLGRNIRKITGLSPVEFILELRLQKAYQIIQERKFSTIGEVRYEVGIESASYFTSKFKERFGIKPSKVDDVAVK